MTNKNFWDAMTDLSPGLFKTYVAVSRLSDNEIGYCFASNTDISNKLIKHEKSISRDINDLISLGYLFVNNLKSGFKVIERRLYINENYKLFLEDNKNIKKLIKTKYQIKDSIMYFYNEKNLPVAGNKNVTRKFTSNNFEDCTSNKNEERAGNRIVTLTNTNIINTKLTTILKKTETKNNTSNFDFLNILDIPTKQNILKFNPKITESKFKDIYSRCELEVEQGYAKSLNAILVLAMKGAWNFQARKNPIPKVSTNKIIATDEKVILEKQNRALELETKQSELETLKSFYETLSPKEKAIVMDEALEITLAKGIPPHIAKIIAENESKFKVLRILYSNPNKIKNVPHEEVI